MCSRGTWGDLRLNKYSSFYVTFERIQPFHLNFVLLLQEVMVATGKHESEKADVQIFAGKQDSDWRGTGIAHATCMGRSRNKLLQCGTGCLLSDDTNKLYVMSGHIPHHATLLQTEAIVDTWKQQFDHYEKALLGWDANETFTTGMDAASIRRLAAGNSCSSGSPRAT
eukprot:s5604_g4.t1